MEIKQLRYFLTAAKTGHITRAAEELHIAQPALSQAIQRLEAELGVPLFDRKKRGVVLNANGQLLQERLIPLLEKLDGLAEEMQRSDERRHNTIRVNIIAAYSLIAEHIIAYRKIHPEVNFQLVRSFTATDCDFVITNLHPLELNRDCDELLTERLFLAVPPESRFASMRSISLRDVASEGFIMCGSQSPIRIMCENLCMRAGFFPRAAFESENPEFARTLIGAGMGIGFWPEYTWGPVRSARLLPITDPDCRRSIVMIPPAASLQNLAAAEFSEFLKSANHGLER